MEKYHEKTTKRNAEIERKFYVWQCTKIEHQNRPRGKALSEACGYWQFKSSYLDLDNPDLMFRCKSCGRKARARRRKVDVFHDKESAKTACNLANRASSDDSLLQPEPEPKDAVISPVIQIDAESNLPDEDWAWYDEAVSRGEF